MLPDVRYQRLGEGRVFFCLAILFGQLFLKFTID